MSLCRGERRPEDPSRRRRPPAQPPTPPDPDPPRKAPPCAAQIPATEAADVEAAVAVAETPALPPLSLLQKFRERKLERVREKK